MDSEPCNKICVELDHHWSSIFDFSYLILLFPNFIGIYIFKTDNNVIQ